MKPLDVIGQAEGTRFEDEDGHIEEFKMLQSVMDFRGVGTDRLPPTGVLARNAYLRCKRRKLGCNVF
jgi:hypothetical protein